MLMVGFGMCVARTADIHVPLAHAPLSRVGELNTQRFKSKIKFVDTEEPIRGCDCASDGTSVTLALSGRTDEGPGCPASAERMMLWAGGRGRGWAVRAKAEAVSMLCL